MDCFLSFLCLPSVVLGLTFVFEKASTAFRAGHCFVLYCNFFVSFVAGDFFLTSAPTKGRAPEEFQSGVGQSHRRIFLLPSPPPPTLAYIRIAVAIASKLQQPLPSRVLGTHEQTMCMNTQGLPYPLERVPRVLKDRLGRPLNDNVDPTLGGHGSMPSNLCAWIWSAMLFRGNDVSTAFIFCAAS